MYIPKIKSLETKTEEKENKVSELLTNVRNYCAERSLERDNIMACIDVCEEITNTFNKRYAEYRDLYGQLSCTDISNMEQVDFAFRNNNELGNHPEILFCGTVSYNSGKVSKIDFRLPTNYTVVIHSSAIEKTQTDLEWKAPAGLDRGLIFEDPKEEEKSLFFPSDSVLTIEEVETALDEIGLKLRNTNIKTKPNTFTIYVKMGGEAHKFLAILYAGSIRQKYKIPCEVLDYFKGTPLLIDDEDGTFNTLYNRNCEVVTLSHDLEDPDVVSIEIYCDYY